MKKKQRILNINSFIAISLFSFVIVFTVASIVATYERQFDSKIYPGIMVDTIDLSGKTKEEVVHLFEAKNKSLNEVYFAIAYNDTVATVSATDINLGFNPQFIADQAFTIGRTGNIFTDSYHKGLAWFSNINLSPSYSLNSQALEQSLSSFAHTINTIPIDAEFVLKDNRVVAFGASKEGQAVDFGKLEATILGFIPDILARSQAHFAIPLPIKIIEPAVTLADTNNLGIKEHIGNGASKFTGSITNRIHNIMLSASRIDGTIVPPGKIFSFNDAVGDISKLTGYKEAYIIKDGRTILGDGGGVCQVSTTLFRAVLNTGLPIVERHAHAYRPVYYELDSGPGLDATIYSPSYDFRFKNDTGASILIEAYTDVVNGSLTFDLYGTSDGRKALLTKSVITNQVPPPEDRYEDDPTLPKGKIKQVDFKATGAKVTFSRTVTRDGKTIIQETFTSNYRPWQAVFLRGTRE